MQTLSARLMNDINENDWCNAISKVKIIVEIMRSRHMMLLLLCIRGEYHKYY